MSAPLRFLVVAVAALAGIRAATLGILPGAEVFGAQAEAAPPPIVPTEFPPIAPVALQPAYAYAQGTGYPPYPATIPVYYPYPVAASHPAVVPAPAATPLIPSSYALSAPAAAAEFYAPIPPLEDWPLSDIASASFPAGRSTPAAAPAVPQPPLQPRLDRIQLTAWALLRDKPGPGSLASGGTLGGSQAGARLTYAFNRHIAASLRTSSPVGGSTGGEAAAGVRLTPFPSIPVSITAERRQAFGRVGTGRSAFALFAEGGLYQTLLPWNLSLDAYAQAGVVGMRSRDLFADGAVSVMHPLYGPLSVGFGSWAGAQPGLYRVDAGPRLSLRVRGNMRVDLDWRQRLAGNAAPSSGPALTLAGNF